MEKGREKGYGRRERESKGRGDRERGREGRGVRGREECEKYKKGVLVSVGSTLEADTHFFFVSS